MPIYKYSFTSGGQTYTGETNFDGTADEYRQALLASGLSGGVEVTPVDTGLMDQPGDATSGGTTSDGYAGTSTGGSGTDDIGINLKAPDGTTVHTQDYNDIQTKLSEGYKPISSTGAEVPVEEWNGGWLIAGVPVNTIMTGTIDPSQYKALQDAGKWNPEWNTKVQLQYFENVAARMGITPENSPQIFEGLNTIRQQYGFTGPTAGDSTPPPPIDGGPTGSGTGSPLGPAPDAPPSTTALPSSTGGASQLAPFDSNQYKGDPKALLNALMNRTATAGNTGSAAFDEILNGIFGAVGTARETAGESYARQRQLFDMMLGRVNPALDQAMGQAGQDLSPNARFIQGNLYPAIQNAVAQGQQTGLSPEAKFFQDNLYPSIQAAVARGEQGLSPQAMAALQTQAMDAVPQNFNRIEQNLRTQLARRGAIGSNELPGSAGDIVREFGDLEAQKEGLRSSLMSQAALSDEQARQQNRSRAMDALNLGSSYIGLNEQATQANRGNALQALGLGNQQADLLERAFQSNQGTGLTAAQIANQLLGTGGQLFDPSAWLSSQNQLFGTAGNAIGGQNQSQQWAGTTMANLGQTRADLEPESLRNLLLSGLMGIGGNALSGWLQNQGRTNTGGGLTINLGGFGSGTNQSATGTTPPYTNPWLG